VCDYKTIRVLISTNQPTTSVAEADGRIQSHKYDVVNSLNKCQTDANNERPFRVAWQNMAATESRTWQTANTYRVLPDNFQWRRRSWYVGSGRCLGGVSYDDKIDVTVRAAEAGNCTTRCQPVTLAHFYLRPVYLPKVTDCICISKDVSCLHRCLSYRYHLSWSPSCAFFLAYRWIHHFHVSKNSDATDI